jgi:hypothetical protein
MKDRRFITVPGVIERLRKTLLLGMKRGILVRSAVCGRGGTVAVRMGPFDGPFLLDAILFAEACPKGYCFRSVLLPAEKGRLPVIRSPHDVMRQPRDHDSCFLIHEHTSKDLAHSPQSAYGGRRTTGAKTVRMAKPPHNSRENLR